MDNWWAKWRGGGRDALLAQPKGRPVGVHQVLGEAEQAAVRQAVLDYRPCDVGLVGQLWTRSLIGGLIPQLYRVRLTEPGVGKYLKRWGLSFQRPDKRAVEQDPEPVRRWHEETWPAIRAKAKAEGGEILFADQVGVRSDQVTGRTWGEKGRTPIVRRTGNRFSVNAITPMETPGVGWVDSWANLFPVGRDGTEGLADRLACLLAGSTPGKVAGLKEGVLFYGVDDETGMGTLAEVDVDENGEPGSVRRRMRHSTVNWEAFGAFLRDEIIPVVDPDAPAPEKVMDSHPCSACGRPVFDTCPTMTVVDLKSRGTASVCLTCADGTLLDMCRLVQAEDVPPVQPRLIELLEEIEQAVYA